MPDDHCKQRLINIRIMSEVRRSARIRTKSTQEEEVALRSGEDGDFHYTAREVRADETTSVAEVLSEMDESSESDEDKDNDDEDYEQPSTTNKKRARGTPKAITKRSKSGPAVTPKTSSRAPTISSAGSKRDQDNYLEMIKDFQPTELFEILSTSEDVSIDELLRNWLETYTANRDLFLQEFINLLLCCSGALARVEEHDVHSNESSNETIGEVQLMFQRQKIHEFHLLVSKNMRKKSKYQYLYNNFVEFMSSFMDIANDAQLLYAESADEDGEITTSPLVLDLLTWLSSLSVCKLRCLRYISTLTLYLFQDFLSQHVVDLDRNYLSKLSKQLVMEQKKKRSNAKTLEKLESAITEVQSSKMVTQSIIDNIIKLCFVHRFKDVDNSIRCLSMVHLSIWIKSYPEYFLKVTFLKYFGWLLSDSSAEVRLQVLKILPQLIARNHTGSVDNSAVRQFFERFKERLLEIALKDNNLEVRIHAVDVLVEVVALGYLEDSEILAISSLIFDDNKVKISSHGKNSRFLAAAAKFFAAVSTERCKEFTKSHDLSEELFGIKKSSAIKIGIFTSLLNESLIAYLEEAPDLDSETKIHILFQAAAFLYPYFGSLLEDLCHILTYDGEYDIPDLQAENSENEEEDTGKNDSLLLPNEGGNIILYVTILSGLSYGGTNARSQPRFQVAEAVLPQMEKLLTQLPIQSSNVLASILSVFNLFSFEDWIHTGYEKSIRKIVEKIITVFTGSSFSCKKTDLKYKCFSETVQHIKKLGLNELDELWLNQITHLKYQLNKFLEEKMSLRDHKVDIDEKTNTLYGMFINKFVLLGKVYTIEFDHSTLSLLLESYVSQIPAQFDNFDHDTIEEMDFKIFTILVSSQLRKWTKILEKSASTHIGSQSYHPDLHSVSAIVETLNRILISLGKNPDTNCNYNGFLLKWSIANALIDIIISLKVVELGLPESEMSWKNAFKNGFPQFLQEDASPVLLQVFLYLESLCAKEIGIQLDRSPEEDVDLNDLREEDFSDSVEKQLLLFAIKLKGLTKLGLIKGDIVSRISLNKDKLGSLYASVIDDTIFQEEKRGRIPHNKKQLQLKEHEPIDEQSQGNEETADIDMLQNDPIDDSEI